jgi:hypothetical protein
MRGRLMVTKADGAVSGLEPNRPPPRLRSSDVLTGGGSTWKARPRGEVGIDVV